MAMLRQQAATSGGNKQQSAAGNKLQSAVAAHNDLPT